MKKKIEWLSVLQGLSMLLVVVGHVDLTNIAYDPSTPIASIIHRIIYSFHMPLFIFISGWLFYYTCIRKEKSYKDMITSKAKRLLIPFFVFTIVTMALKMAFPQLMHRVVDAEEIINTFVFFRSNPLGEMWFIIVLFELMFMYPLYRYITGNKLLAAIGLGGAIIISFIFPKISYFNLWKVAYMLQFFVAGILCSRFEWQKYIGKDWFFIIFSVLFVVCNIIGVLPRCMEAETAFVGTIFTMSLCLIVSKYMPKLFSSYRDYTFQIFLIGIFFQMAIRWVYARMANEWMFVPLWIMSVVVGVYAPTLIARIIDKRAPRYIKMCFGL